MNRSSFTLKALTAALILASSTGVALAGGYKGDYKGEAPCPMLKSGWYAGAQGGYDLWRVRNSVTTPGGTNVVTQPAIGAQGFAGGLFLGYGMMMNDWFYFGGEIVGNWTSADENFSTTDTSTYTNKFEADYNYGIALYPGVKMTDATLTFVKLGWNWANVETKETVTGAANGKKSETVNGFALGVGMETLLMDDWSLRGEFSHTFYSDFRTGGVYNTRVSPSDNQAMLGLIYHFA